LKKQACARGPSKRLFGRGCYAIMFLASSGLLNKSIGGESVKPFNLKDCGG